jgi:tetratricopeptide (TPR) repeat protein
MPPVIHQPINAIEKAQTAVRDNPQSADAHSSLGWALYGKGQLAEALKSMKDALALDGNHIEARYGLGLIHKAMGSKMEAIAEFQQAATLASKIEDRDRKQMLSRLIRGHINLINSGDWNLGRHLVEQPAG